MPRSSNRVSPRIDIGVIGDHNPAYRSHVRTNQALEHAAHYLEVGLQANWIPTASLNDDPERTLRDYGALLCAPGSPYKSMKGALNAIKFARESKVPFLGTCGGFQHMVIEFARNVVGVEDADHAEEHPEAPRQYITPLACSLKGKTEKIQILPHTRAADFYKMNETEEQFNCSFGLNATYRPAVEDYGLRTSGIDANGEVRILELSDYPLFIGTLYQPQMSSSFGRPHVLLVGLLRAALGQI